MNRYAQLIFDHYHRHHPQSLTAMSDPARFCSTLGAEAEATVARLRDELLGEKRPGENLEDYRQRSYQALRQAEELVLAELTQLPAGEATTSSQDRQLSAYRDRLADLSTTLATVDQSWTDTPTDHRS